MIASADAWDYDLQRDQTAHTVAELIATTDLSGGEAIVLDLEFVPDESASATPDPAALMRKLAMFGYTATAGDDDDDALRVEVPDVAFGVEGIWLHEERTTKLALLHGYLPDGWGFWEPGD